MPPTKFIRRLLLQICAHSRTLTQLARRFSTEVCEKIALRGVAYAGARNVFLKVFDNVRAPAYV